MLMVFILSLLFWIIYIVRISEKGNYKVDVSCSIIN